MDRAMLYGRLERLRFASLVQMLLGEGVDGRLEVRTPDSQGQLWLKTGRFATACLPPLTGADAVIALLMSRAGAFAFFEAQLAGEPELTGDPFTLLIESLRVQDHWEAIAGYSLKCIRPDPEDTPLTLALKTGLCVADAAASARLYPVQALPTVEAMLNGGGWTRGRLVPRSVAPFPAAWEEETADTLWWLEERRMLEPSPLAATPVPPLEPAAPREPPGKGMSAPGLPAIPPARGVSGWRREDNPLESDRTKFQLLMEQGLEAFQRNQLDRAEHLWSQAGQLYPDDRRLQLNFRVLNERRRRHESSMNLEHAR